MFAANKTGVTSTPAVTTDPYFNYTTLLLNDTGTNGAQNNTFVDSSTNNFSITRTGNTTQGSFNPYEPTGYWSAYFDGSGDSVTSTAASAALNFTGAFTVECWFFLPTNLTYLGSFANYAGLLVSGYSFGSFQLFIMSSGTGTSVPSGFTVGGYGGSGPASLQASGLTIPLATWHHVAVSRDASNNLSIFFNGTRVTTAVRSGTYAAAGTVRLGGDTVSTNYNAYLTGYISNVRVVKDSAYYDPTQTSITVPTSPLTAITNTSLLCLQDNRFKDNSTNNFTITRNGDTAVTGFNPFAPTASYTTSAYGGSAYFDGSGDYLDAPANSAFAFGTGDFTVESWIYGISGGSITLDTRNGGSSTTGFSDYILSNGSYNLYINNTTIFSSSAGAVPVGTWNHIAVSRSGTTMRVFINGALIGSLTNTTNFTDTKCRYGTNVSAATGSIFYQANSRIVKGTAVYTAAFTPPSAPVTAVTNTVLLLNQANAGIYDATALNDLETAGNAQVSTSQAKWGASSMAFDGTGDVLAIPNNNLLILDAADFTIECWVRFNSKAAYIVVAQKTGQASVSVANWVLQLNAAGTALVFGAGQTSTTGVGSWIGGSWPTVSGTTNLSTGVWYHVAVTKSGTTYRLFINGTAEGTVTNTNVPSDARKGAVTIGADGNLSGNALNGYIEDLRITKGVARYTANFTPPTAPFPTR